MASALTAPTTPAALQRSDAGLLTLPVAAKILGLGNTTLREIVEAGEVPSIRLGSRCYVTKFVVLKLLGLPDLADDAVSGEPSDDADTYRRRYSSQ